MTSTARPGPTAAKGIGAGPLTALPRLCEICAQWSRTSICAACLTRFAPRVARCGRCARPIPDGATCGECLRSPPPWSACVAALDYGFPWDRLIARLKFGRRPDLAAPLATLLVDALRRSAAGGGLDDAPLVTAMPLGPARLVERGYNQAWQLARRVAPALGLTARADLLLRCRDTPHQIGLPRAERERNLREALLATPERAGAITGREVAVVDDVITTGASARAAASALLDAGAAAVHIWVVARTP